MMARYNTKAWFVHLTGIDKRRLGIVYLRHIADAIRVVEPECSLQRAKAILDGLLDPNQHGHPIALAEGITKGKADKMTAILAKGGLHFDAGRPERNRRMLKRGWMNAKGSQKQFKR